MIYLGSDYRLKSVDAETYLSNARKFANLNAVRGIEGAIRTVTARDEPLLADTIIDNCDNLYNFYGKGGGYYLMAFGIGLSALRGIKPGLATPRIEPEDWGNMIEREKELRSKPGLKTVEEIGGVGILEIMGVNPGYVDGYQDASQRPHLLHVLGFSGLGALHAHDIVHFASQR